MSSAYWNENGKHQGMLQAIWDKFVPAQGESSDPVGEVVRCFFRFVYESHNNGNCNMYDSQMVQQESYWQTDEDEDDYYEEEWELTDMDSFYMDMFETMSDFVRDFELMNRFEKEMRELAEGYGGSSSRFDKITVMDELGDKIGDIILEKHPSYNLKNREETV